MHFSYISKAIAVAFTTTGEPASIIETTATIAPIVVAQDQNPNVFNPQISVVGDMRAIVQDHAEAKKEAFIREIELGLAADADPYLRVEVYLSVEKHRNGHHDDENGNGDNGEARRIKSGLRNGNGHENEDEYHIEIEEAFGVYRGFSEGMTAKFGKFAGAVGRQNRNHRDQLNFLEYPMVLTELFGEHGLRAPGASFSYLLPGTQFNELTFELLTPSDGPLFHDSDLRKPTYLGRFRTFYDFNEDWTALFGVSYINGPGEETRSTVFGMDFTTKWQPGQSGKSFVFESEAYWFRSGGAERTNGFGMFAAGTYEIAPRWFTTVKYDFVRVPESDEELRAWSAALTYKLTEFHHWRAEFQRIMSNVHSAFNRLTFQMQWVIGAHPAHKY